MYKHGKMFPTSPNTQWIKVIEIDIIDFGCLDLFHTNVKTMMPHLKQKNNSSYARSSTFQSIPSNHIVEV